MKSKGFSLIELAVVLLIVAVVAAAVTLRTEGPLRRAQMRDITGQIAEFDRLTRVYARQHDQPLRIAVDLATGRISRSDERGSQLGTSCKLPPGCKIARLIAPSEDITIGSMAISCSRGGFTPSYAMLIENRGGQQQWLLWAGLTGELVRIDDEEEVKEIFALLGGRLYAR